MNNKYIYFKIEFASEDELVRYLNDTQIPPASVTSVTRSPLGTTWILIYCKLYTA